MSNAKIIRARCHEISWMQLVPPMSSPAFHSQATRRAAQHLRCSNRQTASRPRFKCPSRRYRAPAVAVRLPPPHPRNAVTLHPSVSPHPFPPPLAPARARDSPSDAHDGRLHRRLSARRRRVAVGDAWRQRICVCAAGTGRGRDARQGAVDHDADWGAQGGVPRAGRAVGRLGGHLQPAVPGADYLSWPGD